MDIGSIIGIFLLLIIMLFFFIPSGISSSVVSELTGICTGCLNSIPDPFGFIDEIVDELEKDFTKIGDSIANTFTDFGNDIANTFTDFGNDISNEATKDFNSVTHAFGL